MASAQGRYERLMIKANVGLLSLFSVMVGCSGAIGEELAPAAGEANESVEAAAQSVIAPGLVNCDSGSPEVRALCQLALARVNQELDARGITIDKDGVLVEFDDPTDRKIETGHSCTVRAELKHANVQTRVKSSASLDVSGNSLTRPLVIKLALPVDLKARLDIKQSYGHRLLLGSCNNAGSDSYSLTGGVSTTADIVLGFTLNPSFAVRDNGEYAIVLEPKVAMATALRDMNFSLHASGVSPLSAVWTHTAGFSSTLARSTTALFRGDSVSSIFKSTYAWDFLVPVVLGIGSLPRPLEEEIFSAMVPLFVEGEAKKRAASFSAGLEERLQAKVNAALGAENGKRIILIKKDFLPLLTSGADPASLFVDRSRPPNPRAACEARASQKCSPDPASCEALSRACHAEEQAYLQLYPPIRLSSATPMEPRR
jgi:hypothetical protein